MGIWIECENGKNRPEGVSFHWVVAKDESGQAYFLRAKHMTQGKWFLDDEHSGNFPLEASDGPENKDGLRVTAWWKPERKYEPIALNGLLLRR